MRKLKKKKDIPQRLNTKLLEGRCCFVDSNNKRCKNRAYTVDGYCRRHGQHTRELTVKPVYSLSQQFDVEKTPFEYIDKASQGLSKTEICAEIGISENTLSVWRDKYGAMARAIDIGDAMHEAWWISQIKENIENKDYNTQLVKYVMNNKTSFTERQADNIGTINNNNVGVLVMPSKMSVDDWEQQNKANDPNIQEAEIVQEKLDK